LATGANLLRVLKWLSLFAEHDFNERHWHLSWFGVEPEFQGKGLGRRLLGHFCALVDSAGEAAYVTTDGPANVGLYEGYGFKVIREVSLFDVKNWLMKRPKTETHD